MLASGPNVASILEMIGHQHEKRHAPRVSIPIETHGCEQDFDNLRVAELVSPFWLATNGDEKNRVRCSNEVRRIVRQGAASDGVMRGAHVR